MSANKGNVRVGSLADITPARPRSDLPPKADISIGGRQVRYGPLGDITEMAIPVALKVMLMDVGPRLTADYVPKSAP
jgi:hypothetical protein